MSLTRTHAGGIGCQIIYSSAQRGEGDENLPKFCVRTKWMTPMLKQI